MKQEQYRACRRLLGAILLRWIKDAKIDQGEISGLSDWLDLSYNETQAKINEFPKETRGRRPGSPGGRPRKHQHRL